MNDMAEEPYKYIESGKLFTRAIVEKYDAKAVERARSILGIEEPTGADFKSLGIAPYETVDGGQPGNLLTNVGIQRFQAQLIASTQLWDSTHTAIGVGTGTGGAAAGDTDLSGGSKYFKVVDSTPTSSAQVMTFIATFGTAVANHAWEEWGVVVPNTATAYTSGTSKQASYVLLNHKVVTLGTKTSAQSWTLTVTITIA